MITSCGSAYQIFRLVRRYITIRTSTMIVFCVITAMRAFVTTFVIVSKPTLSASPIFQVIRVYPSTMTFGTSRTSFASTTW